MSNIKTFEKYLYEKSFQVGEILSHKTFNNVKGTVEYGPSTFNDVKSQGYSLDDETPQNLKDKNLKVWYGISLNDGTKIGIHQTEFKK